MTEMTDEQLKEIVGSPAMRDYADVRDYEKPRLKEWAAGLQTMTDDDLFTEAVCSVSGAALANSRSWYWDPDHFKATACYWEARRRHVLAGHDDECRGDTIYSRAHATATRNYGHEPLSPSSCSCGKDN